MKYAVIITAAGSSSRMGGGIKKEYRPLAGGTVLSSSVSTFIASSLASVILITMPSGGESDARTALLPLSGGDPEWFVRHCVCFTEGGDTRQKSVFQALSCLAGRYSPERDFPGGVMIHDGARPWVTRDILARVAEGILRHGAVTAAIPAVDTQKETDDSGRIIRHLERRRIAAVQTPQGFRFAQLLAAHRQAADDGLSYTDDTEIWGRYAGDVFVCEGDVRNKKITYREDIS